MKCRHKRIVAVELVTGERVAHICLDCDADLPADFASPGDR